MQRTCGLPKSRGGAQCNTKSSSAKVVKVTRKIGPLPSSKGGIEPGGYGTALFAER